MILTVFLAVVAGEYRGSSAVCAAADCPGCVVVALDLDPNKPGFQTDLEVAPGTQWARDVTIWIYDPNGAASLYGIGYVGGVNRGVAFGHMPEQGKNLGQVVSVTATAMEPVVGGHTAFVNNGIEKLFTGPELQYVEYGSTPGLISANPTTPVVTADIELAGAVDGDVFRFYLGDMTAVWMAGWQGDPGAAFSTKGLGTLDAGGDAKPDGTVTAFGVDPDEPVPSPPAPFLVDYADSSNGGGATIRVVGSVPTVSEWGLVVMTLLMLTAGTLICIRRRTGDQSATRGL
jgi:hypothetical protein